MNNNEEKRASALEIYQNGYQSIFWSGSKIDSKSFFVELRNAVIYEIEKKGNCELVNKILEQGTGKLDIVAYAALEDINQGLEDNTLTDVEKDPVYKEYVPHVRSPLRWHDCEFGMENVPVEAIYEDVYGAIEMIRLHHIHNDEIERETLINTDKKNIEVVEGAKEQAEKILLSAKVEAKRITNDANAESSRIIEKAKARAKEIDDSVAKEAKDKAEKLVSRYLIEEQKSYKLELNNEMRKFTDAYIENSSRAMTVHTEMCDATNAVQVRWIQALDDAISKMTDIKSEFYSHLHNWQGSLFSKEIKPLAERYLELYRIINVDKLLREEILLKPLSGENSDELTNKKMNENDDLENRIVGLQKLNKTLITFLRRFEVSLNGLDLYVFYPNPGDEFDETWHILEDEDYEGKYIKECVVPGIAKKANDDFGDDVLIPAVVKVERES